MAEPAVAQAVAQAVAPALDRVGVVQIAAELAAIRDLACGAAEADAAATGWRQARPAITAFVGTDPAVAAVLIGACAAESAGFSTLEETFEFSEFEIADLWPEFGGRARLFARHPERLAGRLFDGIAGNKRAGDGWTYRARGWLTDRGRARYRVLAQRLGVPLVASPEFLARPEVAWMAACLRLRRRRLGRTFAGFARRGDLAVAAAPFADRAPRAEATALARRALEIIGVPDDRFAAG